MKRGIRAHRIFRIFSSKRIIGIKRLIKSKRLMISILIISKRLLISAGRLIIMTRKIIVCTRKLIIMISKLITRTRCLTIMSSKLISRLLCFIKAYCIEIYLCCVLSFWRYGWRFMIAYTAIEIGRLFILTERGANYILPGQKSKANLLYII